MPYASLEKRKSYHREYMREYNKTHSLTKEQKESKLSYMKEYAQKNSDRIKTYDKQYRVKPEAKFKRYVYGAKIRDIDFNLSSSDFVKLLVSNCHYCGTENANGVDRINNDLGYLSYNVVPCCKICNYMKLANSYDDFIAHIKKIINNLEK